MEDAKEMTKGIDLKREGTHSSGTRKRAEQDLSGRMHHRQIALF